MFLVFSLPHYKRKRDTKHFIHLKGNTKTSMQYAGVSLLISMTSPSSPPLFSLVTTIKLAFYNVLSCFWPRSEAPPVRTLTRSTKIMSYRVLESWWSWSGHQAGDCLPIYLHGCQIEVQSYQSKAPLSLGKTVLGLTFQAIVSLTLASNPGQPDQDQDQPHLLALHMVGVAMVIAFAACFSSIFLTRAYPRAASLIEKIGSVSAALGFFLMTSIFLSNIFIWICWLACVFSLLAFTLALTLKS